MDKELLWSGAILECGYNETNFPFIKVNNKDVKIHLPEQLILQLNRFLNRHERTTTMLKIYIEA